MGVQELWKMESNVGNAVTPIEKVFIELLLQLTW